MADSSFAVLAAVKPKIHLRLLAQTQTVRSNELLSTCWLGPACAQNALHRAYHRHWGGITQALHTSTASLDTVAAHRKVQQEYIALPEAVDFGG